MITDVSNLNTDNNQQAKTINEEYYISKSTSLVAAMFENSNPGDLLIYRRYTDGHDGDVHGEYALIPYQLISSHECFYYDDTDTTNKIWEYAKPIGISIGGKHILSLDEEIQPWAGDGYTGLNNTNYAWKYVDGHIDNTNINVANEPYLSEINGYVNTRNILDNIISDDMVESILKSVSIKLNSVQQANKLYDDLNNRMIHDGYSKEDIDAIIDIDDANIILKDIRYKSMIYALILENNEYDLSKSQLDNAFNKDIKTISTSNTDPKNNSWKNMTSYNNVYIDQNGVKQPLTIKYKYSKLDLKQLGNMYRSDNVIYEDTINKNKPVYSESTNAFLYADQYSTVGTTKGDWFVPSKQDIQNLQNYDVIDKVNHIISAVSDKLPKIETTENPNYLTSSQCWWADSYCYCLYAYYRYVIGISKQVNCRVRLMLKLDEDDNIVKI